MKFSWKNESDTASIVDSLIVCRIDERIIGKLHYYKGVGYFAYLHEQQLNRSPIESLKGAMNLVQDTYTEWLSQRGARYG